LRRDLAETAHECAGEGQRLLDVVVAGDFMQGRDHVTRVGGRGRPPDLRADGENRPMTGSAHVLVDGSTLTCSDVVRVAERHASVGVDAAVWDRVRQAHEKAHAASVTRAVYGRTTGVGANRDATVAAGDASTH